MMPGCPSCGRPVALARPTCVYCGAALADDPARVAPPEPPTLAAPPGERLLVVLDASGADEAVLAEAAGLSRYDASRLVRRGGPQLLAILEPDAADRLAGRFAQAGLHAILVPELEARREPLRALAGERTTEGLELRTEAGPLLLTVSDLLLVVSGPIRRERAFSGAALSHRKVVTARPDEGWCAHLHRRSDPRPLELDPARIELGFTVTGSARLEIASWIAELARAAPHDEAFRHETPALGMAEGHDDGLRAALAGSPAGGKDRDASVLYDNLAQFRFYSGWRAAVLRQRADSRAPRQAC